MELIARPALRLLVTVPFGGEIDGFRIVRRIGKAMHDELLIARLLQTGNSRRLTARSDVTVLAFLFPEDEELPLPIY